MHVVVEGRLLHLALFGGVALHVENLCALDKILIYFPPLSVVVVALVLSCADIAMAPHPSYSAS